MSNIWVACLWIEKIAVSVERRRLPDTEGEPLALADANGTVAVASDEAEHWGVGAGMTIQGARSLCSALCVFPYDRPTYEIAARPVWDLIATETSVVEPATPEVCYAEMHGAQTDVIARLCRLAEGIAPLLKAPIRTGIARSKFVALRAAQFRSPNPHLAIPPGEETQFLAQAPLDSLLAYVPKLDLKSRQQLDRFGVKTLGDLTALSSRRLPKALQRIGNHLSQLARGFDNDPVRPLWPPRTICEKTTFTDDSGDEGGFSNGVDDLLVIENHLVKMAERIAAKLAAVHEYTREITLRVGLLDGSILTESERLTMPEAQVPPLYRAAMRPLQRLCIEQPIVSLEVVARELGAGSGVQLSLMDAAGEMPHERAQRLDAAISFLRKKYGPSAVITGALLRSARRIHLWTYSLARYQSDLLEQVATDAEGTPLRYWRRGAASAKRRHIQPNQRGKQLYEIRLVHNRWRETGMRHGILTDAEIFRVETDPFGVSDIRRLDQEWRLTGITD